VPLAMPATLRLLDAIRLEVILSRMITQLNTGAEARQEIEAGSRSGQKPGNDNVSLSFARFARLRVLKCTTCCG
jgi:hypothetical protein